MEQIATAIKVRKYSYGRVRDGILAMIRERNLQPGDRLPSERDLSKHFGLNHQTVRKGLAALVAERIIDRRIGSGTFLLNVPDAQMLKDGKSLSKVRARTYVGAIVLPNTGTFVTEMLGHLHDEAEKRGLEIHIRTVRDFGPRTHEVVRQMADQGCNSFLIPWLPENPSVHEVTELVQTSPIPAVMAMVLPGLEAHCYEKPGLFGKADHVAIEMACRYFHELGYGHIAFFGPDRPGLISSSHRVFAYNRFTSRQGLGSYVGLVGGDSADVDRIVAGWSSMAGDLAVICYDDDLAIRLMTAIHKRDLRIPQDIALLGFNNIPLGASTDPPLSTIQFDYRYVAGSMLDHSQALAAGGSAQRTGGVKESLVIRESCGGKVRGGDRLAEIVREAQKMLLTSSR